MAAATVAERPTRALVFIGFMGSGKSTAARAAAARLGTEALDSDALLEERLGHSIAEEIAGAGEDSFRSHEEAVACELLAGARPGQAISLGGGSVLSARVREALHDHLVVYLQDKAEDAWERMGAGRERRPLAADWERFERLHAERAPLYEDLAQAILPAGRPAPARQALPFDRAQHVGARALDALQALSGAPPGSRMVWAWAADGEYPAIVGSGLYARHPSVVSAAGQPEGARWSLRSFWPQELRQSRSFAVCDRNVGERYLGAIGDCQSPLELEPGEQSKSLASAQLIWSRWASAAMSRADHVVALGGGVVGDLAGFCAATYQRGVPIVHLPTTVVAQVDSAYGGKTGVDLPEAKNYVGAYHQPAAVIADVDTLRSLPQRELNAGWVEVLKTALIAGGQLWQRVSSGVEVDGETIFACVRCKLAIVAEDERDGGLRQVLNLGHTVGHAIESASHYSRYRHGEAVGLGLLAALTLSGLPELRAQVRELLAARTLPCVVEGLTVDAILDATKLDKKRLQASVPFVLLDAPGQARFGCEVDPSELRSAVAELIRSAPRAVPGGRPEPMVAAAPEPNLAAPGVQAPEAALESRRGSDRSGEQ